GVVHAVAQAALHRDRVDEEREGRAVGVGVGRRPVVRGGPAPAAAAGGAMVAEEPVHRGARRVLLGRALLAGAPRPDERVAVGGDARLPDGGVGDPGRLLTGVVLVLEARPHDGVAGTGLRRGAVDEDVEDHVVVAGVAHLRALALVDLAVPRP